MQRLFSIQQSSKEWTQLSGESIDMGEVAEESYAGIDIPTEDRDRALSIQRSTVECVKVRGAIDQKRELFRCRHTPTIAAWLQTERHGWGRRMLTHVEVTRPYP